MAKNLTPERRTKVVALFRMMGSDQNGERDNAHAAIIRMLDEAGLSWNDLPDIIAGNADEAPPADAPWSDVIDPEDCEPDCTAAELLDLATCALQEHVQLDEGDHLVAALWAMHTHVFDRFSVTPRLALTSPVRGCGKTTLLCMLAAMSRDGQRFDGITPAGLFRLIDATRPTLALDEVDTYELKSNADLRGVLHSGHLRGGNIGRVVRTDAGFETRKFSTFAPVALAAIGADSLPLPLQQRSIFIAMRRANGERPPRRLDDTSEAGLLALRGRLTRWAAKAVLDPNPSMPAQLRNRAADNWRPLIAIADACGGAWGAMAREIAVATSGIGEEDLGVALLSDIRSVFDARGVGRVFGIDLVAALDDIEDGPWSEWTGTDGKRRAGPLTQAELARLLRPFHIRPKTLWPIPRTPSARSRKGYLRSQFEQAWAAYCHHSDTPAPSVIQAVSNR